MIKSMTGFSRNRKNYPGWGSIIIEIRSVNHRFLDIILHLPEGFLHFEQKFKDEIGKKLKRGRVDCRIDINYRELKKTVLNKQVMKGYCNILREMSKQLNIKEDVTISDLIGLPGVVSIDSQAILNLSWARLQPVVKQTLEKLIKRRQQEGRVLFQDLTLHLQLVNSNLKKVKSRYRKVIKYRLKSYTAESDKNAFLKSSDINEEIVRLAFHIKNFTRCLKGKKAVGKELDFILQEMQREANTIGAKSIDAFISGRIVTIKSEIERIREQVQNIE